MMTPLHKLKFIWVYGLLLAKVWTVSAVAEYKMNFASVGIPLHLPNNSQDYWASLGESSVIENSSASVVSARNLYLSYPLSGWEEEHAGTNWRSNPWFGTYDITNEPWVYHATLGWVFLEQLSSESLWLWLEELGWVWTSAQLFPYFYQDQPEGWLSLNQNSSNPVLVYDHENLFWFEIGRPWQRLNLVSNPSDGGEISTVSRFRRGDSISLLAIPSPGFLFVGWDGDYATGENPIIVNKVESDINLVANFRQINSSTSLEVTSLNLDHLDDQQQKLEAMLEFSLFGYSDLIGSSNNEPYVFSPSGDFNSRLLASLGKIESNEIIGVFDTDSAELTHSFLPWKLGETKVVTIEGNNRGIINVEVTDPEWQQGVYCSTLKFLHTDQSLEKRWMAEDNLGNVWLIHSTLDDQPLQTSPSIILPSIMESGAKSWPAHVGIPSDYSIVINFPAKTRASGYGLIEDTANLYLHRSKNLGQIESYAPGLGLVKIFIP